MSTDKQEQHILDEHVKTDGDAYARSEELRRDTEDGEYNGVAFNSRDGVMARRKVDMYLVSTLVRSDLSLVSRLSDCSQTLYYFLRYVALSLMRLDQEVMRRPVTSTAPISAMRASLASIVTLE